MKPSRTTRSAIAVAAALGVAAAALAVPAASNTRSTVILTESNVLTGLNGSVVGYNLVTNSVVSYLSGYSWWYYDNAPKIVNNRTFGSYKIVKNTATDFRVEWRVNPGRVWSDGTPITAEDMLLSHIISSSEFSKRAGLGDPLDKTTNPAFNSLGYGNVYDNNIVGNPSISKDGLAVTLRFKNKIPDWQIYGVGVFPVHTLVHMAKGKTKLGSASENLAAKKEFRTAFTKRETAKLRSYGQIWSTAYNIKAVDQRTNPLLLVRNGAYRVVQSVPDQSVTLQLSPNTNSGPKPKIRTIVIKFIADGTAAAQAVANRELDVYSGQPTADAVRRARSIASAKIISHPQAVYEHVDVRTASGSAFSATPYTGIFAGGTSNSAADVRARDLRTAFLLAFPRDEIVDKIVKPLSPSTVRLDSLTQFPSEPGYAQMVNNSGVKKFTDGTQAQRTAQALALVKKYYPNAAAGSNSVRVSINWGAPSNERRADMAALIRNELQKAGFEVNAPGNGNWPTLLGSPAWDAMFFAWVKSALIQAQPVGLYKTGSGNNYMGFSDAAADKAGDELQATSLSQKEILDRYQIIETALVREASSLGIFQHPGFTVHNSSLLNIKPSPLTPSIAWNHWEWRFR
jgi:peptide/nickel transport system substrate-binding protein